MNNLIIVGSGASFDLNLPTTRDIDYILFILLDYNNDDIYENPLSIEERIKKFDDLTPIKKLKKAGLYEAFKNNIVDLLMILKDGDGETDESVFLKKRENYIKEYVEKHYKNLGISPTDKKKEIYKNYIEELPIKYDWLALKSICHEIKNKLPSQKDNRLQTLLTELEFSRLRGISVFARNLFKDSYETRKLFENDPSRLNSAINVYNIFLYKIFKHFIMLAEEKDIQTYVDFYKKILMKNEFKPGTGMADSEKYCHKTSFATYNWDPFLPYFLMKANYELNQEYKKVCNKDNILTKSFIDFSYPFPIVKLSGDHVEKTAYSVNESTAFIINDITESFYFGKNNHLEAKMKMFFTITKLYAPHGLFNLRICNKCGNSFMIFNNDIGKTSLTKLSHLFLNDPIPSEVDYSALKNYKNIKKVYEKGRPDMVNCPSCGQETYFNNTYLEIQAILKELNNPLSMKIKNGLNIAFAKADHILTFGYSFPVDDLINPLLFQDAIMMGKGDKYLSSFDGPTDGKNIDFHFYKDSSLPKDKIILKKLFKKEKIRINNYGFLKAIKNISVDKILNWK